MPTTSTIRNVLSVRLAVCWFILLIDWLLIGYIFSDIFPERILRISGSKSLTRKLRGHDRRTETLKVIIVFASLVLDWLLFGLILSKVLHNDIFEYLHLLTLQDAAVYGGVFAAVWGLLVTIYASLLVIKWRYISVINIRKTIEIIAITTGLIFISQFFQASFLYFPIFISVLSLFTFIHSFVSLGGTPHSDEHKGLIERLEDRHKKQLKEEEEEESERYFDRK